MNNSRLLHIAAFASVATALLLVAVKLYTWWITSSVSILSSLMDSGLDALVSIVNLLAVRYALVPPDEDHRFGHTSAEDLAALFQALFISVSALFIGYHAVERIINPHPLAHETMGLAVMVFSILMTGALVLLQRYVVRRTGSIAIDADSFHYFSDLMVNSMVIVALLLAKYTGLLIADPLIGFAIAAYIGWGAFKIGKAAFDRLMDKELPEAERDAIKTIILGTKGVKGIHDLKTRASGLKPFIQCHVEMDGDITLKQAHVLSDAIEEKLQKKFPGADIILHQDPYVSGKRL